MKEISGVYSEQRHILKTLEGRRLSQTMNSGNLNRKKISVEEVLYFHKVNVFSVITCC